MKYCLFCFFLIFSASYTFSQEVQVFGKVTDTNDNPLPEATINYGLNQGTITDNSGNFSFQTESSDFLKLTIRFIGYETLDTLLEIKNASTLFLDFKLKLQVAELPNVEITAEYQNIFEDYQHHILDFTVSDDIIYLIIQKGRKSFLTKANLFGTILDEQELSGDYKRFHNSCLGGIILVGDNYCSELHEIDDEMIITNDFSIDHFEKYMIPCKIQKDEVLIFKGVTRHNKKVDYFRYFQDHNPHIIYSIHDKEGEDVSKSYYRDMIAVYYRESVNISEDDIDFGFGLERYNIIDDGDWKGDVQDLIINNITHQYVSQYQALGLKEVKSELFVVDDKIYILDQLNNQIVQVNDDLESAITLDDFNKKGDIKIISDYKNESYFLIENTLYSAIVEKNKFNITPLKELEQSFFTQKEILHDGILYRLGRTSINDIRKTIFRDTLRD